MTSKASGIYKVRFARLFFIKSIRVLAITSLIKIKLIYIDYRLSNYTASII
jgi:hypothetical protein